MEKITDLASFKFYPEKWKSVDHKYNKVFGFVDWNNTDEKYAQKTYKSTFFKESFLNSPRLTKNSPNENDTLSTPSPSVQTESQPTSVRKSTRQNLLYKSNQIERKCIICNNQRYIKGRLDQLINIALKRAVDGAYVAESTLKEYAEIHLKLDNEKCIDSANRILLVLGPSLLFAADVSYHKSCYDGFRSPLWKTKLENKSTTQVLDNKEDSLHKLFRLIQFLIVQKHEICTLAQHRLQTKSTLRSIDLKNKLVDKFNDKLKFMKSSQSSTSNTSKFVMSAEESVLPNCLSTVVPGGGIQKSLLVKNCGKVVSAEIQDRLSQEKRQWPPKTHDILEEKNINTSNNTLFNLIASIVSPNSTLDENGAVKLSKVKATKVSKICEDVETLIPNAKSSLSQVLLSLDIYRKTCSSEVITDLHRTGHGLSYTETKFIEDKWAELSENQSKLVPNNIDEDGIVTLVADNIDWKNKTFKGEETRNTNSILIQENTLLKDTERKSIVLQPNYEGVTTTLHTINFVRGKCKLLEKKRNSW